MADRLTYRLTREHVTQAAPILDADQQRVVDHPSGPLLVIAGPGTGKTTTLVEAIADRITERGASPDSILALTFGRKAAEQLRDRVTARVGRTTSTTSAMTFHSFAYALVRRYAPTELYAAPLRLLSASEQDVVLRELLEDRPESVQWPRDFRLALGTRGFAREVQGVLSRAREHGLDPADLTKIGTENDVPEFVAAGLFMEEYLTNLDAQGATDYADLIRRAVIEAHVHRTALRMQFPHVFVDEYQDTDPAQVALLHAIAGDGANLMVVGDPHQSIYGFRGADVRGILEFPSAFPQPDGKAAPIIALRTTRRFGPTVLDAAAKVAAGLPWGPLGSQMREALGTPIAAEGVMSKPVEVRTFDTDRAEAEHIADLLRRAHLNEGIAWDEMAVLVRSGRAHLPPLRRALAVAGVPVETAADEIPLAMDPAIAPLLEALRAVTNLDNDRPENVDYVDPTRAHSLLTGPLCGLDAAGVRRLSRLLRARSRSSTSNALSSPELLRCAVLTQGFLEGLDSPEAALARDFSDLLHECSGMVATGESAEAVLWKLWSSTSWPRRLRLRAEAGGGSGALRAHRDLDALVALFELAARHDEQRDHSGLRNFVETLAAQHIPSDTLAERGLRGSSVRLLTAHRSKGLQWKLVVLAHVQEEAWPNLRQRSSLLRADRLGDGGLVEPTTRREVLIDERRLFYVGCTRAEQRLVVTAVASSDSEGEQPSRFLKELGLPIHHTTGKPQRPLAMASIVAELRRCVADPDKAEALRNAAAHRLADLAALSDDRTGRALVPEADPRTWWGMHDWSQAPHPLRAPTEPVALSATMLTALIKCPAQWFFITEAGGQGPSHQAVAVGNLVHKIAEETAGSEVPPTLEDLMDRIADVWDRLQFRTPWSRIREHERIRLALVRFLRWHENNPRLVLGTEKRFDVVVEVAEGVSIRLTGTADRLELDADGRVVVVDFKTGRTRPSTQAAIQDPQLALYQLAVDSGGFREGSVSGGAELVQLGSLDPTEGAIVQAQPPHLDSNVSRLALLNELVTAESILRSEVFAARPGDHCKDCTFVAMCPAQGAQAVVRS